MQTARFSSVRWMLTASVWHGIDSQGLVVLRQSVPGWCFGAGIVPRWCRALHALILCALILEGSHVQGWLEASGTSCSQLGPAPYWAPRLGHLVLYAVLY